MSDETGDTLAKDLLAAARAVSYLDPGGLKALRQCDEERGCPDFWRIYSELKLRGNEVYWAQFLKVVAILTSYSGSPDQRLVHSNGGKLGALLISHQISSMRFLRLINADLAARRLILISMMMRLGAGTKVDVVQLGYLMMSDNPIHIRNISRQYYGAERKLAKN